MEVEAVERTCVTLTTEDGSVIGMSGADGTLSIDPLLMSGRAPAENKLNRVVRLFETLYFADVRAGTADSNSAVSEELAPTTAGFEFSMPSSDAEVFGWTLDDLTEETAS
ncbi:hypothetical protein [Thioclava pacifica]|uniref:Uncharacterized protein n=1 Tax=Thioclava pacifica DSM 10166 TaxID=1353537 RepID=A0A074JH85_9RHOB|nr:hypothetical protein [Thioclava pacifica]KEO55260.1 hypothetical protein TP2_15820 [Thioclava pacifica DSM 10166]